MASRGSAPANRARSQAAEWSGSDKRAVSFCSANTTLKLCFDVMNGKRTYVYLLFVSLVTSTRIISGQNQSTPGKVILEPYTTCTFPDGLKVVKVDSLGQGVTTRSVDTSTGPRNVEMTAGLRIMFAYPQTDFYANVNAELLPSATYLEEKQWLVDSWQYSHVTSPGTTVNSALTKKLHGFEVHGFDRDKLEGGVLGFYLMFDDRSHVATTFYLLNQEPDVRNFKTIEEYRRLRDRFLETYTSCIRTNQKHHA